ncbi:alpha/beta hydrolase [soil metagenome]
MTYVEVATPDGRSLEVLLGGDPAGHPWVYHGGSPSAAVPYAPLEAAAVAAGLRLITCSRPGYGGSSPRLPAQGAPRFADDVADTVTVLDHLGVDEFVTLGWSGGGPRALGCAALLPGRCRAAASLSGVAPRHAPDLDWFSAMAPENVAEYTSAEAGAEAYAAYLTADFLPIMDSSVDELAASMGELFTDADRAALTPELGQWLADLFHRAAAQGVVGVRDDGLACVSEWGFDPTAITVPTSVWQVDSDAMVPFAHGEWLAAHVPGARSHLLPGSGHLLIATHLDEALAELRELALLG